MTKRITEEECEALYQKYETPPHVIRHCRAVSRVACEIGRQLNLCGRNLDLDLIKGAGLAHDVARVSPNHGEVGGDILESLGYMDEAAIVRVHMHYSLNDFAHLNETDLVCLGDRLVIEDRYAGLDKRFDYIINKAPKDSGIRQHLIEIREINRGLIGQIEEAIGQTLGSLFTEDKKQERQKNESE